MCFPGKYFLKRVSGKRVGMVLLLCPFLVLYVGRRNGKDRRKRCCPIKGTFHCGEEGFQVEKHNEWWQEGKAWHRYRE